MQLRELLASTWTNTAPLNGLDSAFANFLQSQQASDDARHLWLAALVSHQWGRGHACLDLQALNQDAAGTLGWTAEDAAKLPNGLALAASSLPWAQGSASPLVFSEQTNHEDSCARLYLRRAWFAEQSIRAQVLERLAQPCDVPADLIDRLDVLFPPDHDKSTPDLQRQACEVAARHRIALITGGPGTGKTTTVVRLLALLIGMHTDKTPLRIHLAAPTGKAAARLSESIRNALRHMPESVQDAIPTQAQTLHRLLQVHRHNAPSQLASDVVVIDEASMVDLELMARLLQAVPPQARLVLLGDKDQLASVEAGAVMAQLCNGQLLRQQTVTLTHSHRFDDRRGIGQWARCVNSDDNRTALQTLWRDTPEGITALHTTDVVTRLTLPQAHDASLASGLRHGWREWLQILTPHQNGTHCSDAQARSLLQAFSAFGVLCALREGPWGVQALNRHIEQALGLGGTPWYAGRPVMITRNDYALGLMNGDIGLCLPGPEGALRLAFPGHNDTIRWINPSRLEHVETVFAMTVHKSQGSEFEHVLLVLPAQDTPVLTRELVYTGLTRARDRLTLWVPQPELLWTACARRVLRSGGLQD